MGILKSFSKTSTAGIYLLKVWYGRTRTMCGILKKLTIKIPEQRRSAVVTANFEQISVIVLVFTILALGQ